MSRTDIDIVNIALSRMGSSTIITSLTAPTFIYHPKNIITSTVAWTPESIAVEAKDITVVDATLGDIVTVGFNRGILNLSLTATVTATDTVTAVLANNTSDAINVTNGTLRVRVEKLNV